MPNPLLHNSFSLLDLADLLCLSETEMFVSSVLELILGDFLKEFVVSIFLHNLNPQVVLKTP